MNFRYGDATVRHPDEPRTHIHEQGGGHEKRYATRIYCRTVLLLLESAFVVAPRTVRAAQTETQTISIDATTCVQTSGGALTRDANSIQSSSTSAWTIRCPIDPVDSSLGAATITGLSAYGKATSDFTTSVLVSVFRRSTVADTTRSTVTSCSIPGNNGVATSCSSSPSHAVVDNTDAYYVEFSVPASQGSYWELSGARVTYTWVNGP